MQVFCVLQRSDAVLQPKSCSTTLQPNIFQCQHGLFLTKSCQSICQSFLSVCFVCVKLAALALSLLNTSKNFNFGCHSISGYRPRFRATKPQLKFLLLFNSYLKLARATMEQCSATTKKVVALRYSQKNFNVNMFFF